jgi:hypothetical protein
MDRDHEGKVHVAVLEAKGTVLFALGNPSLSIKCNRLFSQGHLGYEIRHHDTTLQELQSLTFIQIVIDDQGTVETCGRKIDIDKKRMRTIQFFDILLSTWKRSQPKIYGYEDE